MQGIIVLIVYALLMVGATKAFTKREDGGESFHVGHRNMGMVVSAMSIAATWIWAPALFTSAEKAYSNGIAGLFWFLVPNILCLILFIPFARKIRRDMPDGITLSGYMHKKYKSEPVKRVYLFQLTALTILSTAVQLLAGGKILSTATGLPLWAMTIVLAVIAFSYSQISGIKASVFTDAIQMVFLLLACAIFVPWALKLNGWTLPIVVRPDYTIIDGFHRWTVAGPEWKYVPPSEKDKRTLFERLGGKVLVVIVDHKDKAGNIYGTVTHNRARGTHLLEPMKKIVKELMEEGKSVEEIGKQLGMRPEEIFRLSEFSKEDFLKMMVQEKKNFSKAEYITKI